jgi:hypothetical protein
MTELATNVLYYGDNLDILRRYLPDASVGLIYLDPRSTQRLVFEPARASTGR